MVALRAAEIIFLVIAIFLAFRSRAYLLGSAVLALSFLLPHLIRRHAYSKELRKMANFQVEANRMEWQKALDVAKFMLDLEIREGRRIG